METQKLLFQLTVGEFMELQRSALLINAATAPKQEQPEAGKAPTRRKIFGDRALAEALGCTLQTVGRYRREGWFNGYRIGRKYFYYLEEVEAALKLKQPTRFGELRGRRRHASPETNPREVK